MLALLKVVLCSILLLAQFKLFQLKYIIGELDASSTMESCWLIINIHCYTCLPTYLHCKNTIIIIKVYRMKRNWAIVKFRNNAWRHFRELFFLLAGIKMCWIDFLKLPRPWKNKIIKVILTNKKLFVKFLRDGILNHIFPNQNQIVQIDLMPVMY